MGNLHINDTTEISLGSKKPSIWRTEILAFMSAVSGITDTGEANNLVALDGSANFKANGDGTFGGNLAISKTSGVSKFILNNATSTFRSIEFQENGIAQCDIVYDDAGDSITISDSGVANRFTFGIATGNLDVSGGVVSDYYKIEDVSVSMYSEKKIYSGGAYNNISITIPFGRAVGTIKVITWTTSSTQITSAIWSVAKCDSVANGLTTPMQVTEIGGTASITLTSDVTNLYVNLGSTTGVKYIIEVDAVIS